ncbi:hypothetical protein ACP4OV_026248 [Aristida adscensionis]
MSSSSSGDDTPPQSVADAASPPPEKLRLHICGMNYAAGSSLGTNDNGDRATFFGNPCLDLFLLEQDGAAPPQRLRDLLANAWDQDALTALKIVCHRRTVKRDKEGFFAAATWMLQTHPRVFADNVPAFAELGYVPDLADLLQRLDVHEAAAPEAVQDILPPAPVGLKRARDHDEPNAPAPATTSSAPPVRKRARHDDDDHPGASATASATATAPATAVLLADPAPPAAIPPKPIDEQPVGQAALEMEVADPKPETAAAPEPATTGKPPYRTLYDAIVDFFVNRLTSDLDHLDNGDISMISLAADWCPSMGSPSDQTTLLRLDIAQRLFPRMDPKYAYLKDEDCDRYVRVHLRQSVLKPLVSAVNKHKQQASESEAAKAKVRASKLPHLIAGKFASKVWGGISDQETKVTIQEWRTMVDDLRAKGSFRNCIAVCDVSPDGLKKGKSSKLLNVCISLGLLISELSDEPWKNWVHAFSDGDGSHSLAGKTSYVEKLEVIQGMKCNESFNLRKVLEWILSKALSNKVHQSNMVKTIFVFTGKDFEQAIVPPSGIMRVEDVHRDDFDPEDVRRWSDDYRIMCNKFQQNGYDDHVPGIVLWNLK